MKNKFLLIVSICTVILLSGCTLHVEYFIRNKTESSLELLFYFSSPISPDNLPTVKSQNDIVRITQNTINELSDELSITSLDSLSFSIIIPEKSTIGFDASFRYFIQRNSLSYATIGLENSIPDTLVFDSDHFKSKGGFFSKVLYYHDVEQKRKK